MITSFIEAEYMAAEVGARKVIWILRVLKSLKEIFEIQASECMNLYMNNQRAIFLIKNPRDHVRTKHIDVQHHFIRELIQKETIVSMYVSSRENAADILTKPLAREAHEAGARKLGLVELDRHGPAQ
jgi:hypothetical protein